MKNPNLKLLRWRVRLNEYDYDIIYKKGFTNCNSDAISRNPLNEITLYQSDNKINTNLTDDVDPLDPNNLMHKISMNPNPTPVSIQSLPAIQK